ncbi:MAG: rane protein [Hymenobacter sp.]|jgi:integral membrane protein|nr:rane protein [Hymenobacter sp.]
MMNLLQTGLGRLRLVAFLEGVSFLVLLLIAMPLKYLAGQPGAVRPVGMAHGVLFVLYVVLLMQQGVAHSWPLRKVALGLIASVVPLGTFWADRKLFQPA